MLLVREWCPLQVLEHTAQGPQSPNVQSWPAGPQGWEAQLSKSSKRPPQPAPFSWAFRRMLRARYRWPPSQDLEHADQTLQSDQRQSRLSASQGMPHFALSAVVAASQSLPPRSGACFTLRVRLISPFPQVTEHVDHLLQSDQEQSTVTLPGQSAVLHTCVSCTLPPHIAPPFSERCSTLRVRYCWPPSQLLVQADHSDHKLNLQSITSRVLHLDKHCSTCRSGP
mmetsp:Transcript_59829/g.112947  ORF Transcript_59829/g.112947 Transcript_59829/m.112947 type:complete len:225 (+) Transcript_59829:3793-4467(+)